MLADAEWDTLAQHLRLSDREIEIVRGALAAEKVVATALRLRLSPHTVHTYRERLFRKLNVRNGAELVAAVLTTHIVLTRSRSGGSRDDA